MSVPAVNFYSKFLAIKRALGTAVILFNSRKETREIILEQARKIAILETHIGGLASLLIEKEIIKDEDFYNSVTKLAEHDLIQHQDKLNNELIRNDLEIINVQKKEF